MLTFQDSRASLNHLVSVFLTFRSKSMRCRLSANLNSNESLFLVNCQPRRGLQEFECNHYHRSNSFQQFRGFQIGICLYGFCGSENSLVPFLLGANLLSPQLSVKKFEGEGKIVVLYLARSRDLS